MVDLLAAVDALDRLVAHARSVVSPGLIEEAARVARRVRLRRLLLGESIVIALAGGTGSGKSSLLNAIAGEQVSATGVQRPLTGRPLVWMPANPEPGLTRLLDAIGIEERIGHDRPDRLVVIDLPDTDSVELEHRMIVSRLIPEVDAVVWVMDPEKYHDRVLHQDHIAPLAAHADRMLFVLNQVDRITPSEARVLVEDLKTGLMRDGHPSPRVLTTAADPASGPPLGIDDVVRAVTELGDARRTVEARLLTDCRIIAGRLGEELAGHAAGTGFTGAWTSACEEAAARTVDSALARSEWERHGRAVGLARVSLLPRRPPDPPRADLEIDGGVAAARILRERLDRVGAEAGPEWRRRLLQIDVEGGVSRSVDAVDNRLTPPSTPEWLSWPAWIRRLAALVVVLSGVWWFETERRLLPALAMAGGLVLMVALRAFGGSVGRRSVRRSVEEDRRRLETELARQFDRTIGRAARDILRQRAQVGATMAELSLVMARLGEDRQPGTKG